MNRLHSSLSLKHLYENFTDKNHIKPFMASVFIFGLAIGIYQNVLHNYFSEVLQFSPTARGWAEFFRELPGLSLIAIFALLYRFTESKLIRIAFGISCLGMIGLLFAMEQVVSGIMFIVVFSTGEHILMPIRDSFAMHYAQDGRQAKAMGQTKSVHGLGLILGFVCVSLIFYLFRRFSLGGHWDFRLSYAIAAVCLAIGFILTLNFADLNQRIKRERFYFRKKYWKYYVLEIFFGARKQVFLTFGPYVLILIYGLHTEYLSLLFILNNLLGIALAPKLGQLIDYFGYKIMLIVDAILLVLLCLSYGFVPIWLPNNWGAWLVGTLFV
ncbi:MAG: MFS transporter, partial [Spirochaetota bacterium]